MIFIRHRNIRNRHCLPSILDRERRELRPVQFILKRDLYACPNGLTMPHDYNCVIIDVIMVIDTSKSVLVIDIIASSKNCACHQAKVIAYKIVRPHIRKFSCVIILITTF